MVPAIIAAAGLLQSGLGIAQRAKGLKGLKKAEEMYQKNPYQEDTGILDVYNRQKALASASGLDSVEGRLGQQQIQRNLLTGLRASAGQRGRDVEGIIRGATGSTAGLIGRLAQMRRGDIAGLSSAAQAAAGERMKKYKFNVLDPAARKTSLEAQRASEGGSMVSSGLRNIISGISSWEQSKES
jgi:hypothetical protein